MENYDTTENQVLEMCKEYKDGITHQMIQNTLQGIELQDILLIINKLLAKNKVDLLKTTDGRLLIKYKDFENKSRYQGGNTEEKLLVKLISESQTNGIEAKELRIGSNLNQKIVTNLLKSLEQKNIIKYFFAISAPKRKRFILKDLEPNPEMLPGELYSGDQYDSQLIEVLSNQCCKFLERKSEDAKKTSGGPLAVIMASWASAQEVLDYIQKLGILKAKLKDSDIESILDGLYYEGKLDQSHTSTSGDKSYRFVKSFSEKSALMSIPCGFCPKINICGDVGLYSSLNCKYMKEFDF